MKTRYKIAIVIVAFTGFYFALIPILEICHNTDNDCTVWQEMMFLTRPVITSSQHVWGTGDSIGEWSGTPEGIEIPSFDAQVMNNIPFVASMIVFPFVIIGFIVMWDKRK